MMPATDTPFDWTGLVGRRFHVLYSISIEFVPTGRGSWARVEFYQGDRHLEFQDGIGADVCNNTPYRSGILTGMVYSRMDPEPIQLDRGDLLDQFCQAFDGLFANIIAWNKSRIDIEES